MSDKTHDEIARLLDQSASAMQALCGKAGAIEQIAAAITKSLRSGGTLLLCGNGGSASQCQHIASEFTGRYKLERPGFRAIALTTDTSALTSIGNDYGFETIFARQVDALGRPGDVLLGLSTSGTSKNVVAAFEHAKKLGLVRIALTGPKPSTLADMADATLAAPGDSTPQIQECHLAALHVMCEIVERALTQK